MTGSPERAPDDRLDDARPVAEAMLRRRSQSSVTDAAPGTAELLAALEAAAAVADHSSLAPWRVIELRGDARLTLGDALAEAEGATGKDAEKYRGKAQRSPLVLAVVFSPRPSHKVPAWEQEAVASGVAHALSLVLDEGGWGVMWRTGLHTRSAPVHRAHQLAPDELLLGWLYVGGKPEKQKSGLRKPVKVKDHLSSL